MNASDPIFRSPKSLEHQESRIKSLIYLCRRLDKCKVNWEVPTQEYYMQELDELLTNDLRLSSAEFFHPSNYDSVCGLFPYTFKKIAEHSKGGTTKSEEENKEILAQINDLKRIFIHFNQIKTKRDCPYFVVSFWCR